MSGAVDSAVYDYFSLLLQEPEIEAEQIEGSAPSTVSVETGPEIIDREPADGVEAPVKKYSSIDTSLPATKLQFEASIVAKPTVTLEKNQVDKAVLERLLAPVDDLVVTRPETQSKVELKTRVEVKPEQVEAKVKTEAWAQPKVETKSEAKVETKVEAKSEKPGRRLADIVAEVKREQQTVALSDEQQVEIQIAPETQTGSAPPAQVTELAEVLDDEFQVLFFKIAGLTLAVPLVSLGGIIRLESLNHIIGRPAWYLGLQTHRGEQLNVVDTCAWVMPEHMDKAAVESKNYQYVVQLAESNWGLACESLLNATRIDKSQVNWRTKPGKRPWLAGVVKEQMCGILNVDALITMLDAGLGCQDPIG